MAEQERDYEALASKEGWAPEDQWKGDPDKWKTAQQFVEDGEKIIPIMRGKVERLEGRVEQLLESNRQLNERSQRSIEKEKRESARLIKELEAVRKQAITESDGEAFDNADRQIQALREAEVQPTSVNTQAQEWDRLANQWVVENPWYNTNPKLATFADGLQERVMAEGYSGQGYFKEITRRTQEAFPEEFGNPSRSTVNSVEEGGDRSTGGGGRGFGDLPPDAKKEFKNLERDIPGYTKEQYLADYEWDQVDQY